MQRSAPFAAGLSLVLAAASPAAAQPVRAVYEVYAAGMTVLQLEAVFEVTAAGYRVRTSLRTRGLAATFVSGEQVSRVEGAWDGASAMPDSYHSEGVWRGTARRTSLGWQAGNPVVRLLEPADETEHEPVPPEARRGTIDALSAVAMLSRTVARTGGCEADAAVFDGRRRSDFATSSAGREVIRPWRDAWHGTALRCRFESRLVAGFQRDQPREEAARPRQGQAWIAAPYPGAPPIPVRIEMPSRWFGSAVAVLLRAEPSALADRGQ